MSCETLSKVGRQKAFIKIQRHVQGKGLLILEPQRSCESWAGTQQIKVNCIAKEHAYVMRAVGLNSIAKEHTYVTRATALKRLRFSAMTTATEH